LEERGFNWFYDFITKIRTDYEENCNRILQSYEEKVPDENEERDEY